MFSVSLEDYGISASGSSDNQLLELQKALFAGQTTGRETTDLAVPGSLAPAKLEDLEGTLKVMEYLEKDIKLWGMIPKAPAYNTVVEYLLLKDYGGKTGSFVREGELPENADSTWVRKSQLIKYMGQTREVTLQAEMVNTVSGIGNVMQNQVEHATLSLLRNADKYLAFGNSDIVEEEWDGLYKQHRDFYTLLSDYYASPLVIDMKGKILDQTTLQKATLSILNNHGYADTLMAPPRVLTNFLQPYTTIQRIGLNTPAQSNGVAGQRIEKFVGEFGDLNLGWDKFLAPGEAKRIAASATHVKAPAKPVADATTPKAVAVDANQNWTGFLGDYFYAVSAINKFGESGLADLSTAGSPAALLSVIAGRSVDLKFAAGSGAVAASGYIIYRSKPNPVTTLANTDLYPIAYVSTADLAAGYDGGAAGLIRDKNRTLPDTDMAFLLEANNQIWNFRQLAPLFKQDYAQIGPSKRFSVFMYGTPILYQPQKMIVFVNVGSTVS